MYQKYNVLIVFFVGFKELCFAFADKLTDSESRRKFNKLILDALSVPNYVIKEGLDHGARHGKTEEQKEYHMAWNAWERCCKKVDSQGELLQVFTIDFSENKSAKSGMNLHKKTRHIVSH